MKDLLLTAACLLAIKEDTRRLLILSYTDLQTLKGYQEFKIEPLWRIFREQGECPFRHKGIGSKGHGAGSLNCFPKKCSSVEPFWLHIIFISEPLIIPMPFFWEANCFKFCPSKQWCPELTVDVKGSWQSLCTATTYCQHKYKSSASLLYIYPRYIWHYFSPIKDLLVLRKYFWGSTFFRSIIMKLPCSLD